MLYSYGIYPNGYDNPVSSSRSAALVRTDGRTDSRGYRLS